MLHFIKSGLPYHFFHVNFGIYPELIQELLQVFFQLYGVVCQLWIGDTVTETTLGKVTLREWQSLQYLAKVTTVLDGLYSNCKHVLSGL